jgi:hypothetical protein
MHFTATTLAAVLALTSSTSAMFMSSCAIIHLNGNGGNEFTMNWASVPGSATGNICGKFDDALKSLASGAKIERKGNQCHTDNNGGMSTTVTLNKRDCQLQGSIIVSAMSQGLGGRGDFDPSTRCSFSNC